MTREAGRRRRNQDQRNHPPEKITSTPLGTSIERGIHNKRIPRAAGPEPGGLAPAAIGVLGGPRRPEPDAPSGGARP